MRAFCPTRRVSPVVGACLALAVSLSCTFPGGTAAAAPGPSPSPAPVTSRDLPRLTAELSGVTAHAQELSAELDQAASRDGGLRVAYARMLQAREQAQATLDNRARQVYMAQKPAPFGDWQSGLASPDLQLLARRGTEAALTVDRSLVEAVTAQAGQLTVLQQKAAAFRVQLLVQATAVFAEQDRARDLLGQAQVLAAAEHAVEIQRELDAQRALLNDISATVTLALTPAQTARTRRAAAEQAPLVALLEATGSGIPPGYTRSGTQFAGTASWYGPGFVGRPTASGAPYDPERPTCAHKTLPLGTVVHVTANGYETNCLVNDRGPYIGDRVLDMSRAGSRSVGYDGLAQVVVEVLIPT